MAEAAALVALMVDMPLSLYSRRKFPLPYGLNSKIHTWQRQEICGINKRVQKCMLCSFLFRPHTLKTSVTVLVQSPVSE